MVVFGEFCDVMPRPLIHRRMIRQKQLMAPCNHAWRIALHCQSYCRSGSNISVDAGSYGGSIYQALCRPMIAGEGVESSLFSLSSALYCTVEGATRCGNVALVGRDNGTKVFSSLNT